MEIHSQVDGTCIHTNYKIRQTTQYEKRPKLGFDNIYNLNLKGPRY